MRIGYLIPEFPGQTHSFFWREISVLTETHGQDVRIYSTRHPVQPVEHAWTAEADARYLYPPPPGAIPGLLMSLLSTLPRLVANSDVRALLTRSRTWAMLLMALHLKRLCQTEEITHLHVHSCANSAFIAALLHLVDGMSYSLVLHGPIEDYGPNQDFKWRRAAFGFVITEKLKKELLEMLPDLEGRLSVVPMGVDTDVFSPRETPRTPGPWRWFCCSRLNRVKGYDTLIAAATALQKAGHDFHITVAGEDEQGGQGYRREIERMIADAGLGAHITLLGAVSQERVLAELQNADAFVLASLHEPLGVAYMEAMSCGLPVIGTRAGGVAELIEDGVSGLLVPPSDVEGLTDAMVRLMTDPDLCARLGAGGRQRIVSRFGATRSAGELARALGV